MKSEKILKYMSLTILAVIILSVIPAATTLALSTSKHPIAAVEAIETSRDDFDRKVWYNQLFYVDVWLNTKPGDNITLSVTVHGTSYAVNASYVPGTAYQFRAWFNITKDGELYYNSTAGTSKPTGWVAVGAPVTLDEGDTIKIAYSTLTPVTLTFEHTAADLTIRSKAPYPLNLTATNDWSIVAPDLNKDPLAVDNFTAYIEIKDYTQGWTEPKKVLIPFKETAENSGEFAPATLSAVDTSVKYDDRANYSITFSGSKEYPALVYNASKLYLNYSLTFVNATTISTTGTFHTGKLNISGWISLNTSTAMVVKYDVSEQVNYNVTDGEWNSTAVELYYLGYNIGKLEFKLNITNTDGGFNVSITNVTITLYTGYIYRLALVSGEAPGDYVTVTAIVPQYIGADSDPDKDTEIPEIFTAIGTIDVPVATLRTFNVTVTDPDENRDSLAKDSVTIYLKFPNGIVIKDTLTETDADTGVFSKVYSTYDWIKAGYLNSTDNKVVVYETTYYYSSAAAALARDNVTKKVAVSYTTASIEVSPSEVLIPATGTPVETIVLTINDSDLNLLSTVDAWKIEVSAGSNLSSAELKHTAIAGLPAFANLTIKAVKGDKSVPLKATNNIIITFVETGDETGVFKASISLRNFNWTWIRGALGGSPEKLVITYTDIYTSDLKPVDKTAEVAVAKANITVDRDVIPLSRKGDVVLHITVKDPASKGAGTIYVSVTAYNYKGENITTISQAKVEAKETGIETGEFTCDFTIEKNKIRPELIGGKLVIAYGDLKKEIPFELYDVKMYVNGSSGITVKYGDVINVTIVDPDYNLDTTIADEFTLTVNEATLEFKETGPNTGVFVATYTVDENFGAAGKTVDIEYEDPTPTYATPGMTDWPPADTYKVSVTIKSFTGTLLVNGEEASLEVGPVGTLNITIVDWDMNKDPSSIDTVQVYVKLWNGTYLNGGAPYTAEETGENTGVFTYTLDIGSEIGAPDEIIGKNIQVMYRDDVDANSEVTTKIVTVKFISWNPEIITDKTAYNIGDKIKITVKDPDANVDPDTIQTITVRVYSTSDPIGTAITLRETGEDTGEFTGEVLISSEMRAGVVYAKLGDMITIEYTDQYPADYGVTGESKIFKHEVRVGVPVEKPIVPSTARFVDPMTGEEVTPKVGKTVGIGVPLSNTGIEKTTFTVLLIIRDASGAAVGIQWQTVTLPAGESGEAGFTFTPTATGDYTVEVYIIKSLADWTPLGETLTTTMSVTE